VLKTDRERWRVSLLGTRLHVISDEDLEAGKRATTRRLEAQGIRVLDAREARLSLEDVFIQVVETARERRSAAAGV
jgi:hypothetical protein